MRWRSCTATQQNTRIDSNPIPAFPRVAFKRQIKNLVQIRYFRHSWNLLARRNTRSLWTHLLSLDSSFGWMLDQFSLVFHSLDSSASLNSMHFSWTFACLSDCTLKRWCALFRLAVYCGYGLRSSINESIKVPKNKSRLISQLVSRSMGPMSNLKCTVELYWNN